MFHAFRRYPPTVLKKIPLIGTAIAALYERCDRGGWLSDLIADPQRIWEGRVANASKGAVFDARPQPLVSVVVATRNNERTIGQALRSLLEQTLSQIEIVVVDDASTDRSVEIVTELMRADKRLRLLVNENRLGTGLSRNIGMMASRGEFITFQDGDDASEPKRLALQHQAFQKFPSKHVVTCNYVRVDEFGNSLRVNEKRTMKCIISMMFRRQDVLSKIGYFRDGTISEDADYYERIKVAFGPGCDVTVFRTLYKALFRPNSSFFEGTQIMEKSNSLVLFERDAGVVAHWKTLTDEHKMMRSGEKSPFVPHVVRGNTSEIS